MKKVKKSGCFTTLIGIGYLVYLWNKFGEGTQITSGDAVIALFEYLLVVGILCLILIILISVIGFKLVKKIKKSLNDKKQ